MLRLSDFVVGRQRFYNLSTGLCISASKHCRKMKLRTYVRLTILAKLIRSIIVTTYTLLEKNF